MQNSWYTEITHLHVYHSWIEKFEVLFHSSTYSNTPAILDFFIIIIWILFNNGARYRLRLVSIDLFRVHPTFLYSICVEFFHSIHKFLWAGSPKNLIGIRDKHGEKIIYIETILLKNLG